MTNRLQSLTIKSSTTSTSRSVSNDSNEDSTDYESEVEKELLFEVQDRPGRGACLIAKRKIAIGMRILAEHPLISLAKAEEDDQDIIKREYYLLDKRTRRQYQDLFDAEKSRMKFYASIYYSNCYNCDGYRSNGGSCIGLYASRINHSCIPNVQFSFDEENNLMLFHATKAIAAGKEILSNYDQTIFETSKKRQRLQNLHYGFLCTCEACEPKTEFWAKSDERRLEMIQARKDIREAERRYDHALKSTTEDSNSEAVNADSSIPRESLITLTNLLIKEGLTGLTLANTYRSLAKWLKRIDDVTEAVTWKRKELEICINCFGSGSKRVHEVRNDIDSWSNEQP